METLELIAEARIIPTLKLTRAEDAPPLLAALCSGGCTALFLSMRTEEACPILRQGCRLFPDLLLGAADIYTTVEASNAIRSGARIIATSGCSPEIGKLCQERDAFYLPFCATPTELLAVQTMNGKAAGLFAPETFGGIAAVKALSAAFPYLPLIAGAIPMERLPDYLSLSEITACVCPDMAVGSYEEIVANCKACFRLTGSGYF